MTLKDWITTTIAVVAFLISATTAYLNLWPTQGLSIIVSGSPSLHFEENTIRYPSAKDITFINSGNQPIAIIAVELSVVQPQPNVEFKNCDGSGRVFQYEFSPFVIEGGKIIVVPLKTKTPIIVEVNEVNMSGDKYTAMSCLVLSYATSRKLHYFDRKPLYRTDQRKGDDKFEVTRMFPANSPVHFIERRSVFLGEWRRSSPSENN